MIVTLDLNCIVDLEENREPFASHIRALIAYCRDASIKITMYVYIFLENGPKDAETRVIGDISMRLAALELEDIEMIGPRTIGFEHEGGSIFSVELERQFYLWVHQILFPEIDYFWQDYTQRSAAKRGTTWDSLDQEERIRLDRKWNNAKSDVLSLIAHLGWGGGLFVTRDDRLIRRQALLRKRIPHIKIVEPKDALHELARREHDLSLASSD